MKTKVRIIKGQDRYSIYSHLEFQILRERWHDSHYLEPYTSITWQTGGMDVTSPSYKQWYAFRHVVETDQVDRIAYALTIAKHISKNCGYDEKTPENILKVLNAEIHVYYDGNYLPVSWNGYNSYKINCDGKHYTTLYAKNEKALVKLFDKWTSDKYNPDKYTWELLKSNIELISDSFDLK
jgi:hypothetical protein